MRSYWGWRQNVSTGFILSFKDFMERHDEFGFNHALEVIGEVYGKKITKNIKNIYFEILKSYSLNQVEWAFKKHLQSTDEASKFFPKPGDILRHLEGTVADKAYHAMHKILSAVKQCGLYDDVEFDDPVIHAAIIQSGGWKHIYYALIPGDQQYASTCKALERAYMHFLSHPATFPIPRRLKCAGDGYFGSKADGVKKIKSEGKENKALELFTD